MKKLFFSLAICFAITVAGDQLKATDIVNHNMTSTSETISISKLGAYVYITIDGKAITLTDYTGVISGPQIIWGTDWFSVNSFGTKISVYIWEKEISYIPRQARIYMKDSTGKNYQLFINQENY